MDPESLEKSASESPIESPPAVADEPSAAEETAGADVESVASSSRSVRLGDGRLVELKAVDQSTTSMKSAVEPATLPHREMKLQLRSIPDSNRRKSMATTHPKLPLADPNPASHQVMVDFLPGGDLGAAVPVVAGYGQAPGVVEVFPGDDDDDLIEADQIEQIELNLEATNALNIDLSTEYQKPHLARAKAYRRLHSPTKPDGTPWPFWKTRTGRFTFKYFEKLDCYCEGRHSDFVMYGPGVSAYFKWLKFLGGLMLFLCLASIPTMVINVNAGTRFKRHPVPFAQTTLGNLYFSPATGGNSSLESLVESGFDTSYRIVLSYVGNMCAESTGGCAVRRTDLLLYYAIWDALCCVIIIITLYLLSHFTMHEGRIFRQKVPKIEDYSLECNVPEGADAVSLQEHFARLVIDNKLYRDEDGNVNVAGKTPEEEAEERKVKAEGGGGPQERQSKSMTVEEDASRIVYDVQIVESTGNAISLCVTRGKALKRLARLDAEIKVMMQRRVHESRLTSRFARMDKLKAAIRKLDERAQARAEKGSPLMAFVTFESQEICARVIAAHDVFWICGKQPAHLRYEGVENMRVRPAPPPSTLLWENQEVALSARVTRTFMAFAGLVIILLVSGGISFWADNQKAFQEIIDVAAAEDHGACEGIYDHITSVMDQSLAAVADGNQNCFCQFVLLNMDKNSTLTQEAAPLFVPPAGTCSSFISNKLSNLLREIGLSISVLVLNVLIYRFVVIAADFQRFKSITDREMAVLKSVFIISFINTGVIVLLVNADWARLTGDEDGFDSISIGNVSITEIGRFVDFDSGFYNMVGIQVFIVSLFNVFAPHVLPMVRYLYHVFERRYLAPYVISQQVLNEMYVGENFVLSVRLAQTLVLIFYTLLYSSGIPIMYWSAFVAVFLSYWLDKFYFVRLVRTPPQFSQTLQLWTTRTMEWAVVLHALFAFWMYTSPRLFPLTNEEARDSLLGELVNGMSVSSEEAARLGASGDFDLGTEFRARIQRPEGYIMLLTAACIVGLMLLRNVAFVTSRVRPALHVIGNLFRACLSRHARELIVNRRIQMAMSFSDALRYERVAGVRSYNILANPVYQRIFHLQNEAAMEEIENAAAAGAKMNQDLEAGAPTPDDDASSLTSSQVIAKQDAKKRVKPQTMKDALNIRKGGVSTLDTVSHASTGSRTARSIMDPVPGTKQAALLTPRSGEDDESEEEGPEGDDAKSHKSTGHKSTKSHKSTGHKSVKSTKQVAVASSTDGDDASSASSARANKSVKLIGEIDAEGSEES